MVKGDQQMAETQRPTGDCRLTLKTPGLSEAGLASQPPAGDQ